MSDQPLYVLLLVQPRSVAVIAIKKMKRFNCISIPIDRHSVVSAKSLQEMAKGFLQKP